MEHRLLSKNQKEEKVEKLIEYTTPLEETIITKLYSIASKGYGIAKTALITKEIILKAIEEYKNDNFIYTEININNCREISLSFKRILKLLISKI